jgi:hypothetical protein
MKPSSAGWSDSSTRAGRLFRLASMVSRSPSTIIFSRVGRSTSRSRRAGGWNVKVPSR